jgi:hypothetical protein
LWIGHAEAGQHAVRTANELTAILNRFERLRGCHLRAKRQASLQWQSFSKPFHDRVADQLEVDVAHFMVVHGSTPDKFCDHFSAMMTFPSAIVIFSSGPSQRLLANSEPSTTMAEFSWRLSQAPVLLPRGHHKVTVQIVVQSSTLV